MIFANPNNPTDQELRLAFGELTAGELRTAKAVWQASRRLLLAQRWRILERPTAHKKTRQPVKADGPIC